MAILRDQKIKLYPSNLSELSVLCYISSPPLSIFKSKNSTNQISRAKVAETNHSLENVFLMEFRSRNAEVIFKHNTPGEVLSVIILTFHFYFNLILFLCSCFQSATILFSLFQSNVQFNVLLIFIYFPHNHFEIFLFLKIYPHLK